jgi:hypothetical protein
MARVKKSAANPIDGLFPKGVEIGVAILGDKVVLKLPIGAVGLPSILARQMGDELVKAAAKLDAQNRVN